MDLFIVAHTYVGFILLVLGFFAAAMPKKQRTPWQRFIVITFFATVLIMGISGIAIGVYRHPYSISIFQIVTLVGVFFAIIGLLTERGKLGGKNNLSWYINGLGGSLIATVSASLFFLALTYFKEIYQTYIIWFTIIFIAVPVLLGRKFIKRNLSKK